MSAKKIPDWKVRRAHAKAPRWHDFKKLSCDQNSDWWAPEVKKRYLAHSIRISVLRGLLHKLGIEAAFK